MLAGVRGAHYSSAIRSETILAILVGTTEVDLVGMPGRRDDEVVVNALSRAEVERTIIRIGPIRAGQGLPNNARCGGVVRPIKRGQGRAICTIAVINAGFAVSSGHSKFCPVRR